MPLRFEWDPAKNDANQRKHGLRFEDAMTDIPEWTEADFKRSIRGSTRRRIMQGQIESGEDVAALRRFVNLTQKEFARALEISVHTLRNWEQETSSAKPRASSRPLPPLRSANPEDASHDRDEPIIRPITQEPLAQAPCCPCLRDRASREATRSAPLPKALAAPRTHSRQG